MTVNGAIYWLRSGKIREAWVRSCNITSTGPNPIFPCFCSVSTSGPFTVLFCFLIECLEQAIVPYLEFISLVFFSLFFFCNKFEK